MTRKEQKELLLLVGRIRTEEQQKRLMQLLAKVMEQAQKDS